MLIRPPAVAGTFYSDNPVVLENNIQVLLEDAHTSPVATPPRALIVPHAGYIYSAEVAAEAYHQIKEQADNIKRVVILGPSHRVPLQGIAAPEETHFQTPLGNIRIDQDGIDQLKNNAMITLNSQAHAFEHSIEVQLPFLQSLLNDFAVLPLVVGKTSAEQVANILQQFWEDKQTLFVISSDLSHFLSYEDAQRVDKNTSRLIEALSPTLSGEQACGCYPLNGMLLFAKQRNLDIATLDLKNSGDTAGSKDRVVGYGAYVLF